MNYSKWDAVPGTGVCTTYTNNENGIRVVESRRAMTSDEVTWMERTVNTMLDRHQPSSKMGGLPIGYEMSFGYPTDDKLFNMMMKKVALHDDRVLKRAS